MIEPSWPKRRYLGKEWLRRLDRTAADLNVVLVVLAIGFATLDATCLVTQRIIDRLPPVTRVVYVPDAPAPALPAGQASLP
jgi:hypothetical protein